MWNGMGRFGIVLSAVVGANLIGCEASEGEPASDVDAAAETNESNGAKGWIPDGPTSLPNADHDAAARDATVAIEVVEDASVSDTNPVPNVDSGVDSGSSLSLPSDLSTLHVGDSVGGGFTVTRTGTFTKRTQSTWDYAHGCPGGGAPDSCSCPAHGDDHGVYQKPWCTYYGAGVVDASGPIIVVGNGSLKSLCYGGTCIQMKPDGGDYEVILPCSSTQFPGSTCGTSGVRDVSGTLDSVSFGYTCGCSLAGPGHENQTVSFSATLSP